MPPFTFYLAHSSWPVTIMDSSCPTSNASTSDRYWNEHSLVHYDFTFAPFEKPRLEAMQTGEGERLKSPR